MKHRKILYLILHTGLFAWAARVFLDQPGNVTVFESGSATFICSVVNSSFSIFWLVNDTDARYTIFQEGGITIIPINDTTSHLVIAAYNKHNNTIVHCAALKYDAYRIVAWIPSQKALLVVVDQPLSSTQPQMVLSTTHHCSSTRNAAVHVSTLSLQHHAMLRPTQAVSPGLELRKTFSIPIIGTAVAVPLLAFLVVTVTLVFLIHTLRKRRARGKIKPPGKPSGEVKVQGNVAYEYRKPVQCQRNTTYNTVIPHVKEDIHRVC
jgi:hypothetical protein